MTGQPIIAQGGNIPRASAIEAPPKEIAEKLNDGGPKILTADDLLRGSKDIVDYDLPGLGIIRLRPLSMNQVIFIQQGSKGDLRKQMTAMIDCALVEPKLAREQIMQLTAGVATKMIDAVNKVSGIEGESDKMFEDF